MLGHSTPWLDVVGHPIQAHGGGFLRHGGRWYWYGEDKSGPTLRLGVCGFRVDAIGVACYSSTDLVNWRREGLALSAEAADPEHDLHPCKVMERPKVVYNQRTKQFVMWLHVDEVDYKHAACGVAVADRPEGPFRYLGSQRPCGEESRDMTLFQDEDGSAWLIHSSEWNKTLHVVRLSDDYLKPAGGFIALFAGQSREAPAIFRHGGRYHILTSGCSGWDPNAAEHAWADRIEGPWTVTGNPCRGPEAELTFRAQSTAILPDPHDPTRAIACFDRWKKEDLQDSRYLWLPLHFVGDAAIVDWLE